MVSINYIYGRIEKILPSSVFIRDEEDGSYKELTLTEEDRKAIEAVEKLQTPLYFGYIGKALACIAESMGEGDSPYMM